MPAEVGPVPSMVQGGHPAGAPSLSPLHYLIKIYLDSRFRRDFIATINFTLGICFSVSPKQN